MMFRIFMVLFLALAPLSATQAACCNKCESAPSAATVLQSLQVLLNNNLLLLPQLQAQLAEQLLIILTQDGLLPTIGQSFGDFFALMPGDNAATVAPGTAVSFPQDGAISGGIFRVSDTTFLLPDVGTYQVFFQVSVDEAGQLALALNTGGAGFVQLANTVVGRATGTSQIVGMSYVTTTAPNSLLEVWNAVGNATALTITPVAGGTNPVSAHLVILQIQ